jgi:pSer/pThr/pTyr-binding forkhead associated (FHA) protein
MIELLVVDGPEKGLKVELKSEIAYVGRSRNCDIRIRDFAVSRRHLKCAFGADEFTLEDLGSTNGTWIDGQRIGSGNPVSTSPGAVIRLGKSTILLRKLKTHRLDPALREKAYSGFDDRNKDERHVDLLNDVAQLITGRGSGVRHTVESVLERTLLFLSRMDRAALFVVLPDQTTVRNIASKSKQHRGGTFVYSAEVAEKTIRDSGPVILFDSDSEITLRWEESQGERIQSLLCLPLYQKTQAIGALYLDSTRGTHAFRKSDVAMLEHVCALISVYLQREGWGCPRESPATWMETEGRGPCPMTDDHEKYGNE